tara:strand:+ start:1305 stop:1700 length:396 start_codon:yes stop_codon:yes gene_type:complete
MAAIIFMSCSSSTTSQIGTVSGSAEAANKPFPEGTVITFYSVDSTSSFTTIVDDSGNYTYSPVRGVPIVPGKYKVTLSAPRIDTIMVDGVFMPNPKAKKVKLEVSSKYFNKETTPLEVELHSAQNTFDIEV